MFELLSVLEVTGQGDAWRRNIGAAWRWRRWVCLAACVLIPSICTLAPSETYTATERLLGGGVIAGAVCFVLLFPVLVAWIGWRFRRREPQSSGEG